MCNCESNDIKQFCGKCYEKIHHNPANGLTIPFWSCSAQSRGKPYLETVTGKQKMEYVIQRACSMLPSWAQFFITEEVLRKVVQLWFDAVKDLLDDGKVNRLVKVGIIL